jgi:hypothetical protein
MTKTIVCSDGVVVRGETDDELVEATERHLCDAHPELAGQLSRAEILALATVPNARTMKAGS